MHWSMSWHGSLCDPHSTPGTNGVRVTSWSMNCPQVIVTWVKFGLVPFTFSSVPAKTVVLIFLDGWRSLLGMTESTRGLKPGAKAVGGSRPGRRENGILAAPLVILQRLLHVPSKVRYSDWAPMIQRSLKSRRLQSSRTSVSARSDSGVAAL